MLEPPPHPERGKGYHKSCPQVPGGGIMEASIGVSNGDRVVYRSCHGRGGPLQIVRHNEKLVLACVRTGARPLTGRHGKGQELFIDPLSEVRATPPWPDPGYTH